MAIGVRTKEACGIAQIDPSRFNEMVHAGHYLCAPDTRPGSARIFDLDRTVALVIFGNLLSMSVTPDRAGQISKAAYDLFAGRMDVERVVYRRDALGEWVIEIENPFAQFRMQPPAKLVFDVSELREIVGDRLEWEQRFGRGDDNAAP